MRFKLGVVGGGCLSSVRCALRLDMFSGVARAEGMTSEPRAFGSQSMISFIKLF